MAIQTLQDLYLFGIRDMNNGCSKAVDGMKAMREAATHPQLKDMMGQAIDLMNASMETFEGILRKHGSEPDGTPNQALSALGEEGKAQAVELDYADPTLRDLMIVEKARNIAGYPREGVKAFTAQAKALGFDDDIEMLHGTVQPETVTKGGKNQFEVLDQIEASLLKQLDQRLAA